MGWGGACGPGDRATDVSGGGVGPSLAKNSWEEKKHRSWLTACRQECRDPDCRMLTRVFCPACRKAEGGKGGAGFYCFHVGQVPRNCLLKHHCKRMRTRTEADDDE